IDARTSATTQGASAMVAPIRRIALTPAPNRCPRGSIRPAGGRVTEASIGTADGMSELLAGGEWGGLGGRGATITHKSERSSRDFEPRRPERSARSASRRSVLAVNLVHGRWRV